MRVHMLRALCLLLPFTNFHVPTTAPGVQRTGRSTPKLTPSVQKPEGKFELDRGPMRTSPHPWDANGILNQQVRSARFAGNDLQLNASEPRKSNRLGASRREIDDTALDVWTTVIDTNDYGFAGREVGDFDGCPKRQCPMSCGKRMRMRIFAIGSTFAAIHRSNSGLSRCQKRRRK